MGFVGQKCTCFECGEEGHERDKYSRGQASAHPVVLAAANDNHNLSNNNNPPPTEFQPMEAIQSTVTTDVVETSDTTRNVERLSDDPRNVERLSDDPPLVRL